MGICGMVFILFLMNTHVSAQHDTLCSPFGNVEYKTSFVLGYGSATGLQSTFQKSDVLIGQPLVDVTQVGLDTVTKFGLVSELVLEPKAPFLVASQGDFPDRVQLDWQVDKFSPSIVEFRIFRDGAFLGKLDADVRQFIDFNVQAGEVYDYSIKSIGRVELESDLAFDIGFVNPNGVISGQVKTRNGNPVPFAIVKAEPTFNQALTFDGIDDHVCISYHENLPSEQFTFSSWVKIGDNPNGESIVDLGSDINQNWWLRASDAGNDKGVVFGIGGGTSFSVTEQELPFHENENGWHHIAAVYNGLAMTLYLDGEFMGSSQAVLDTAKTRFSFGQVRNGGSDYFEGGLDDVRIFDRALSQTEILLNKDITVSNRTEGLVGYWKFDEGQGSKAFDLSDSQLDGFLFGAKFSNDSPDLMNAGMTDVEGNYIIEGIDYSAESRFTVSPSKIFYNNYSLEFNAASENYVKLPDFDIPDTATIEIVILPFDRFSEQSLLSYGSGSSAEFNLYVKQDKYFLTLNGETKQVASVTGEYDHLALVLDGGSDDVQVYINGNDAGSYSYGSVDGGWTDEKWVVGAQDTLNPTKFFSGLIDEFAVFDTLLTQSTIQEHAGLGENGGVDSSDPSVYAYYNFNESEGNEVYDFGPNMMADGEIFGAQYSIIARRQKEEPHAFEPNERKVNLNYSSTSVDQVNFTDISTVAISGVVRFENTFCYQDSVEILVNGSSYFPPIYTNEEGRFVADFEPGSNLVLEPKFGPERDTSYHNYLPASYDIRRLNVPVANVLFQNQTKREIKGQIFGGDCRRSIIPVDANGVAEAIVKVKLAAQNGCYEEEIQLLNPDGKFTFDNFPPIPVTVSVTEHSNPNIFNEFQIKGGQAFDMREIVKDTAYFQYDSGPIVELDPIKSGLLGEDCGIDLVYDSQNFNTPKEYSNDISVFQVYNESFINESTCYLDSFELIINNGLQESSQENIFSDSSTYVYKYYINNPNLIFPHEKTMQVVGRARAKTSPSETYTVVVLGERQQIGTISTSGPSKVLGIVHDPPGDGSFATLEQGTKTCTTWESANLNNETGSASVEVKFGMKRNILIGTGLGGTIEEIDVKNTTTLTGTFEASQNNSNEAEFCFETTKEISTSDGDDIWGDYADVYFGAAMNFEIGARDILDYDFENCSFISDVILSMEPDGFETDFVLSDWQIRTEVIPQLDQIIEQGPGPGITQQQVDAALLSKKDWLNELAKTQVNKNVALSEDNRNITFDAAAVYTETSTTELTGTNTFTTTIGGGVDLQTEFGFTFNDFGTDYTINTGWSHETTSSEGNSVANTVTTSFTLADDDLNDFYSVDVVSEYKQLDFDDLDNYEQAIDDLGEGSLSPDDFTFRPKDVPFLNTPIFKLRGGESMCPWIPGTRNREEVFVQVPEPVQANVPTNTPAVFRIEIGNIGPNGVDGLVYELGVNEGGNPDGALIKVDGQPLISPVEFQFLGTSSVQKIITVEYPGTGQFNFENLGLYFASVCQIEHSKSVGYDAGDGGFLIYDDFSAANGGENFYNKFYKAFEISALFIEPCSTIDIGFPLQEHVITPDDISPNGDLLLNITLNEYDNTDPDLDIVRVQYRPVPGDGSWINITELPVEEFANNPVFKIVQWDMTELKDGDYEIRAVADCGGTIGGDLSPGISEVIFITKETDAPDLFGTPEPADGILVVGDEISITFNEDIQCSNLFDADGIGTNINMNNVALIDTETGLLVPFSHECVDDKIVIQIEAANRFVDGKVLKAVITDAEDLAGNRMAVPVGAPGSQEVNFKEWEFLVDLNPLRWEAGSNIREVKQVGMPMAVTRNIMNNSGTARNFSVKGNKILNLDGLIDYESIPSWVEIEPRSGTLDPGEILPVSFLFPQDLLVDDYLSDINVVGDDNSGNEISTDLKVRCAGPEWDFDREADFENTMTFTVQLDVFGDISIDNSDRVAAFINGELRGSAYVEFVPAFEGIDNNGDGITDDADISGAYMAFLTVYGDEVDFPEIDFNVFDGSECIVYSEVLEQIEYVPTAQEGVPSDPTVIHVMNVVDRKIPIADGWSWISVNLDLINNSTDNVLNTLNNKDGDLIKDDNSFADYAAGSWIGSLSDISFDKRYLFFSEEEDTICLTGIPYDVAASTIDIEQGWNWIGFVPQQGMLIDEALSSLTPLEGDIIKSQTAFAQFIPTFGWIGNLNVMEAPHGYLLNISNPGVLDYSVTPTRSLGKKGLVTKQMYQPYWTVNTSQFQHNMNITAVINPDNYQLQDKDQIGVFVDGELRGYGQAVYAEPLDKYLLFITASGNIPNELLEFKLFSEQDSTEIILEETMFFKPDQIVGDVMDPFVFNFLQTDTEEILLENYELNVYPNPSNSNFKIDMTLVESEEIELVITEAMGKRIDYMRRDFAPGRHTFEFKANDLPSGVYNLILKGRTIDEKCRLIKID